MLLTKQTEMKKEKLTELLKLAYRWGRDNGEGRSEKNFNDFLDTKAIKEALTTPDEGRREQLLEEQSNWLMTNTSLEVEKIVDFKEHFK